MFVWCCCFFSFLKVEYSILPVGLYVKDTVTRMTL